MFIIDQDVMGSKKNIILHKLEATHKQNWDTMRVAHSCEIEDDSGVKMGKTREAQREYLYWKSTSVFRSMQITMHRVGRVPSFLSSRPNWVRPPSHPQASVAPPLWLRGGHTRLRERGLGGPNSDEGTDALVWYNPSTLPCNGIVHEFKTTRYLMRFFRRGPKL
jgi:hypothetical protein